MKKFVLIASLVLVPLVLAAPSVQAQTSPTNATANSQLANSNTANALGITTGVTTGITTGTPTTGQQQTSTSNRNPTTGVMCIQEITATFCNVPSGPNTNGYGSPGGARSSAGTVEWRVRRGRRRGIGRGVCIRRRRGCQHIVNPELRGFSFGQRAVQLICY